MGIRRSLYCTAHPDPVSERQTSEMEVMPLAEDFGQFYPMSTPSLFPHFSNRSLLFMGKENHGLFCGMYV